MKLLAKFVHGSHLYELNTPSSDEDYKAVYMPELNDMLMGNVKDTVNLSTNKSNEKNTADDVDYEVYSFQKFIKLLMKGEMVCFDMLFAPEDKVEYYGNLETNPVYILRNQLRPLFVHRDMKAYLGYCRRQAAKYGIKGSRLAAIREVYNTLYRSGHDLLSFNRLIEFKEFLPTNEYLKIEADHYEVLGKKHQWATHMQEFADRIASDLSKYGNRAQKAEQNEGVDWKAVSHALRAGFQLKTMFETYSMDVVLDFETRDYILSVKNGELYWEDVKEDLEQLMDEVEALSNENALNLPEKPNAELINEWAVKAIRNYYKL